MTVSVPPLNLLPAPCQLLTSVLSQQSSVALWHPLLQLTFRSAALTRPVKSDKQTQIWISQPDTTCVVLKLLKSGRADLYELLLCAENDNVRLENHQLINGWSGCIVKIGSFTHPSIEKNVYPTEQEQEQSSNCALTYIFSSSYVSESNPISTICSGFILFLLILLFYFRQVNIKQFRHGYVGR